MQKNEKSSPAMSVVLVTPDNFKTIENTFNHLARQTVAEKLELVIVSPALSELDFDDIKSKPFQAVRFVEIDRIKSTGSAIAAGYLQATAPIIAYAEEHAYPEPNWAEILIKTHKQNYVAVGAALRNANPERLVSWASMFTDFAQWVEPCESKEMPGLAQHATSYKRAVVSEYGSRLSSLLETECFLQSDLQAKGYRFYLQSEAIVSHVNVARLFSFVQSELYGGRLYGAARVVNEKWSFMKRMVYVGGSWLIPILRLPRITKEIRRSGHADDLLPRILPAICLGLIMHTIGEVLGYLLGAGDAGKKRTSVELHRSKHIKAG